MKRYRIRMVVVYEDVVEADNIVEAVQHNCCRLTCHSMETEPIDWSELDVTEVDADGSPVDGGASMHEDAGVSFSLPVGG